MLSPVFTVVRVGWCQIGVNCYLSAVPHTGAHLSPYVSLKLATNDEPTSRLLPGRGREMPQSISNQTHGWLFPSTPQRSEIVSTMGRPHPPLMSDLGQGSEGTSKPGPGSHTLPR